MLQVYSNANLTKVKSNISRKCGKNLDLTHFNFVQVLSLFQVLQMTRTSLEKPGLNFEGMKSQKKNRG